MGRLMYVCEKRCWCRLYIAAWGYDDGALSPEEWAGWETRRKRATLLEDQERTGDANLGGAHDAYSKHEPAIDRAPMQQNTCPA